MTAGTMPAGQLYSYDQEDPKLAEIKSKVKAQQEKLDDLDKLQKRVSVKKQKELELERISETTRLRQIKRELVEAQYELLEKKERFFVPCKELYSRVNDHRSKDNHAVVPREEVLWGINDLVITLPNRTKMIVFPEAKKSWEEKLRLVEGASLVETPTIASLNSKVTIDVSQFSKEEIQEYGTQKTNFMYSKYSSIRMFSIVIFMGVIAGVVMYKQKNVLQTIKGSILEQEVKSLLSRDGRVNDILRQKHKKELEFDLLIGGGIANNQFNCVMYIKNLTNGKL